MASIDLAQAEPVPHAKLPDVPGCYVLVADQQAIRELGLRLGSSPAALYVGEAKYSIRKRVSKDHLLENRTGSSTLRRSSGALLREKLDLHPQPRSHKRSKRDMTNYKFDPAGEIRLTGWISANVRMCPVPSTNPTKTERELIRRLRPPLNLTNLGGWKNPEKAIIKAARKQCADLARTSA